jgi:hypothetical protein
MPSTPELGDDLVAAIGGPKPDSAVKPRADQRAIGAKRHGIDVAAMPFQDFRAAIGKIPKPSRPIPGGGGKVFAPRGKGGDLARMAFQDLCRFSAKPRRPKRDAPALTSTRDAPIGQKRQCIDAAAMPTRDGACLSGARIP